MNNKRMKKDEIESRIDLNTFKLIYKLCKLNKLTDEDISQILDVSVDVIRNRGI